MCTVENSIDDHNADHDDHRDDHLARKLIIIELLRNTGIFGLAAHLCKSEDKVNDQGDRGESYSNIEIQAWLLLPTQWEHPIEVLIVPQEVHQFVHLGFGLIDKTLLFYLSDAGQVNRARSQTNFHLQGILKQLLCYVESLPIMHRKPSQSCQI